MIGILQIAGQAVNYAAILNPYSYSKRYLTAKVRSEKTERVREVLIEGKYRQLRRGTPWTLAERDLICCKGTIQDEHQNMRWLIGRKDTPTSGTLLEARDPKMLLGAGTARVLVRSPSKAVSEMFHASAMWAPGTQFQ